MLDRPRQLQSLQLVAHRSTAGFVGINFGTGVLGHRITVDPPMVKDPRYMNDTPRFQGGPEHEVGVLRTIVAATKATDAIQKIASNHQEMRDVVLSQKRLRRPARLEVMVPAPFSILIDLVLIRVEHVHLCMALYSACHLEERCRSQ